MTNEFSSRTELLLGADGLAKLAATRVAVFGLGGVGSYAAEALVRAGVGHFLLVDHDVVSLSNLNRQLHATRKTVGQKKTEAMRERMLDVNPDADVESIDAFYEPNCAEDFFSAPLDYIIDAVDTVTAKLSLAVEATRRNIPIISSMGAGNKLDPTLFEVADIYETSVCPLAKTMRKELKKRGVPRLKVVYSKEPPLSAVASESDHGRHAPGSVSFVPSVAGLILAGEVIRALTGVNRK